MGFGSILKPVTSTLGGARDLLMGKKSEGSADKWTALMPEQQQALGIYKNSLSTLDKMNPVEMANIQVQNQERLARSGVADAQRQAQTLISQRGMNNSTAGLNALLGVGRGLGDQVQAIKAQQPLLQQELEQQKLNRLGMLSGGVNSIYDTRIFTPGQAGGVRSGGLLGPLIGAAGSAAGSYFGMKGMQAGMAPKA